MVRVKICGITNTEDAIAAIAAGADALGFVFHRPSPRYVAPDVVRTITAALPPFVTRVGVFVDSPLSTVEEILAECHLDYAQLHGSEDAAFCAALCGRAIKAVRVGRDDVDAFCRRYQVAAFLLDSYHPGLAGGTGESFDWQIAHRMSSAGNVVVLSGGLRPENVAEAVAVAKPYAVDVASGVEAAAGRKDLDKVRAFVAAAKGWKDDQ